jgi:hypothetical protein
VRRSVVASVFRHEAVVCPSQRLSLAARHLASFHSSAVACSPENCDDPGDRKSSVSRSRISCEFFFNGFVGPFHGGSSASSSAAFAPQCARRARRARQKTASRRASSNPRWLAPVSFER